MSTTGTATRQDLTLAHEQVTAIAGSANTWEVRWKAAYAHGYAAALMDQGLIRPAEFRALVEECRAAHRAWRHPVTGEADEYAPAFA